MLDMDTLSWEEPMAHRMKVERNLNFATLPNDEDDFGFSRKKTARDPMSHRIIEKRRRDRMNNCLADLSRLVPTNYLKKGRGRIEKTEIIEMAIKHLKHLQAHPCKDPGTCEVARATEQDHRRQFRQGYQECMSETMKFMMEAEGSWMGDGVGIRLVNHLQKHYDKISGGLCYTQALNLMASSSEDSKSAVQGMEVDSNHSNGPFPHHDSNHSNGQPPSNGAPPSSYFESDSPSKATSQLREMLQNPGVPKTVVATSPTRHGVTSPQPPSGSGEFHEAATVVPPPGDDFHRIAGDDVGPTSHQRRGATSPHIELHQRSGGEDSCYKFKNTIKHRFNADLRHHNAPASPSDSHVSLSDEAPHPPLLRPCSPHHHHHAFSPYQGAPPSVVSELTVKIPDRTGSDSYGGPHPHWDSHAETASSCSGSNPSPPPARSSGSSSGYSTNGDHPPIKGGGPKGASSPLSPPYSPPSPQPGGVPVFALHPKGAFYIPLTLESAILLPYMTSIDETVPPVLHPISICVNLGAHSVKVEKHRPTYGGGPPARAPHQSSFLMDKFHDRLVYPSDRYYGQCPASPAKNGCV